MNSENTIITKRISQPEIIVWTHGTHSGTATFPPAHRERDPVVFEWNEEPPENWETIEEQVLAHHS